MELSYQYRKALIRLTSGNADVLGTIFLSAFVLIVIRCLCPLLVLLDEGSQIEAAQNLVSGNGLTSIFSAVSNQNLNLPPTPGTLTWWPPGFSLLLAPLLFIQIPLAISLKLIYSMTTAVGWLGWGIIGSELLSQPIIVRSRRFYLNLLIAALAPIFYTPRWVNTDIFLWAGLPFIVILLSIWPQQKQYRQNIYISIAGVLIGLLYFFRYASLSILLGSFVLIAILNWQRINKAVFGIGILAASFGVFFLPTYLFNKIAGNSIGLPEYINPGANLFSVNYIAGTFSKTYTLLSLFGYPFLPRPGLTPNSIINSIFETYPGVSLFCFVMACVALYAAPIYMIGKACRQKGINTQNLICICLYSYFLVTSGFLFITSFLFEFNFFGNPRYYIPFLCMFIFMFYSFLSNADSGTSWGRRVVITYLVTVFVANVTLPSLFFVGTSIRQFSKSQQPTSYFERLVLGYKLSNTNMFDTPLMTNFRESEGYLDQLIQDNQNALFFIQYPSAYFNQAFQKRLRPIPLEEFWTSAYVEQSTQAFFITVSDLCPSICSSYLPDKPITAIENLSSLNFKKDIYQKYGIRVYSATLDEKAFQAKR